MHPENSGRWRALIYAAVMTAALAALLFFFHFTYESRRTLYAALQKMNGAPLSFSEESGFFEKGFVLRIQRNQTLPENAQIRYTLNGDEPTAGSLLYEDGIDLREAVARARAEAAEREVRKAEVVRQAEAEAEAARAAAEERAAAGITGDEADGKTAVNDSGKNAADEAAVTSEKAAAPDTIPGLEEGRAEWEREKWTAASDDGVRPERADDGICIIPVRACLIQGEDRSPVVSRTYVIGADVFNRYECYVASVVTDSFNLFDYDKGIMVPGSHYEQDVADGVRPDRAGNFYQSGDEWIKRGHVTLFSPDGEVLLEEDTGLAVAGYSSRILPTRTLRMEASRDYGTSDDYFHLTIFSEAENARRNAGGPANTGGTDSVSAAASRELGSDLYKKIKFRSHGVPGFHIRSVRNQYAKELTDECGFPGLTENLPGLMFLNGEFYTVCDITPSTTNDYICRLFGLNVPDAVEKYSGSDVDVYTRAKIIKLFTADLTKTENQKALEAAVDMDNYLFYFALEVLFNNADWPYNNVTVWRYLGEMDPDNPCSDGRIRFLLEDMDQILSNNLHGDPARWSTELIDYLMKDKGNTFHHVMDCARYRDRFLTYADDLLKTSFAPDHACAVLDRLYGEMKREYILDYGEDFWSEMEKTARITGQNVREKEALYRADITKYMNLTDRYEVSIETDDTASVTWNNMSVPPGTEWSNSYYRGTSFEIMARPSEGYRIAGWEINGKRVRGEGEDEASLVVSDALLGNSSKVRVRPLTEAAGAF